MQIRPATEADFALMWPIFQAVVAAETTYFFRPDTPREEAFAYWFGPGISTYVALDQGRVVGMYKLVANHPDLGSHVANASFMVDPAGQGRGAGRQMGVHCLAEARRAGFLAMQFNFVVSTNQAAVALWQSLGFVIVGTLPQVYRHRELGLVDAYVMHRFLSEPPGEPQAGNGTGSKRPDERPGPVSPMLESPRLHLGELTAADDAFILELLNDPAFLRHIGDRGVRTRADAVRYIETGPRASYERHGFGLLKVTLRGRGEPVGICGLLKRESLPDPDLGFALLERFRGQGLAYEAASAVLSRARSTRPRGRILAITSPDNLASIGLLDRLGFRFDRMARISEGEPEVRLFVSDPRETAGS